MLVLRSLHAHLRCSVVTVDELPTASTLWGTGVLWVLTGTHPCGPPLRQDGGGYQSASSYVRAYGLRVRCARGRVCGRWFVV